jgi:hypothetical protein
MGVVIAGTEEAKSVEIVDPSVTKAQGGDAGKIATEDAGVATYVAEEG